MLLKSDCFNQTSANYHYRVIERRHAAGQRRRAVYVRFNDPLPTLPFGLQTFSYRFSAVMNVPVHLERPLRPMQRSLTERDRKTFITSFQHL